MIPARRVIFTIVALIAIALLRHDGFTQQSAPGTTTVLTGATLIDGTGRAAIPESVIVIDDGKFTAVGGKGTNFPANANVITKPISRSLQWAVK
ncbi:MAG TPA: hypothetical protein VLM90_03805 [Candidatus Deferrimicrobium sp.]|nr:hypothetical protein [Candidatus Deferrimicrobium sp.]